MSCEGDNLNKMPRELFKKHYLFHSKKAGESGITGKETGVELARVLSNQDMRTMVQLSRFYEERFGVPITEDLMKDMAANMGRGVRRRFFR